MSYVPLASKLIGETITLEYNFQSQMRFGETLDPPVIASVTVLVSSGLDESPSSILTGGVTVSGYSVITKVTAGLGGVIYTIVFHATGSSGAIYRGVRQLAILTDVGSYTSGSLPSLTGSLPDGVVGAVYSANLSISGGYLPYSSATPLPTAPEWMGYTVVGNQLVCAGTPGIESSDDYTFSPRIQDAALSYASSPQTIHLTRTTVSGDLSDGEVGQSVSYNYIASDGTAPYTYSIIDGALPDGLSLSSAGAVTGTFTAAGSFSWTVQAVDVNGISDDLVDTCNVSAYAFIVISDPITPSNIFRSTSGTTWGDHIPVGLADTRALFGGGDRLFVFAVSAANGRVSNDGGTTWNNITGMTSTLLRQGMAYSNNVWVISLASGPVVYRSTDGVAFSTATVADRTYYQGAAIGSTMIFNTTLASLIRSTDAGITWSAPFSNGITQCEQAVATPTAFLIAGSGGRVLRSTTGASGSWTSVLTTGHEVRGLAYGADRVMTLGTGGQSYYSDDDGLTWTAGPTIPENFNTGIAGCLAYGNNLFVAVGSITPTDQYSAIYSTPAVGTPVWTQRYTLLSGLEFNWISSALVPDQG